MGEIGLFQIHGRADFDSVRNAVQGISEIRYWRANCPVKENNQWLICYNAGFRHPKHPEENAYYKKVIETMRSL